MVMIASEIVDDVRAAIALLLLGTTLIYVTQRKKIGANLNKFKRVIMYV